MLSFIIWLIVGGIIGWLASLIMKTDAQQGILLNVVVGIIGAFIGGWLIAPLIGGSTGTGGFDIMGFIAALRVGLDPVFLPRPVRLVQALPRHETGKLPRAAVLSLLR